MWEVGECLSSYSACILPMKGLNVISLGSQSKTHFNIANLFLLKILSASIYFMNNKFIFHFWGLNPGPHTCWIGLFYIH